MDKDKKAIKNKIYKIRNSQKQIIEKRKAKRSAYQMLKEAKKSSSINKRAFYKSNTTRRNEGSMLNQTLLIQKKKAKAVSLKAMRKLFQENSDKKSKFLQNSTIKKQDSSK